MLTFRKESFLRTLQSEGHLDDFFLTLMDVKRESDRGSVGLKFLEKLGVKSSRTAVYEAFRLHFLDWQLDFAVRTASATRDYSGLEAKKQTLLEQRTFEVLARPNLEPKMLVAFVRAEIARQRTVNDSRRVAVLESQMAKAKEKLATVVAKGKGGGLSPEARRQIEEAAQLL